MKKRSNKVNFGYCICGCGNKTPIAKITRKERNWIKGQPIKFISAHRNRKPIKNLYLVNSSGCWIWKGYKSKNGYGKIGMKNKSTLAHRYIFELFKGKIQKSKELDHKCRVRSCVNPNHLRAVSRLINSRCGKKTKISLKIAKEILRLKNVMYYKDVCKKYNIGRSLVYNIWNKKAWIK